MRRLLILLCVAAPFSFAAAETPSADKQGDKPETSTGKTEVSAIDYVWVTKSSGSTSFPLETLNELLIAHELRRDKF